jgi:hypothetical protein
LDETAVKVEKNPGDRAGWEHNVAIMINSLLVRYPEGVVAEASGRPKIRAEGIDYATRSALLPGRGRGGGEAVGRKERG